MADTTEIKITVRCSKCPIPIEDCNKIKELLGKGKCPILLAIEQTLRDREVKNEKD